MPYPPGVSASTPNAPWNDEPVEECRECGGVYTEDGHETVGAPEQQRCRKCEAYWEDKERKYCPDCNSDDIGGLPCPNAGMTMHELEEGRKASIAEDRMDQRRLEEMMHDDN